MINDVIYKHEVTALPRVRARVNCVTVDQEMASEDLAISVRGVYKKYGRGKKAKDVLKGLNMEVPYNTM